MNTGIVSRIEQEIIRIEQDRAKAEAANDAAIEAEESRVTGHTDIQDARVAGLKEKRDAVVLAYDQLRERKAVELATARAEKAAREAKENAESETQAAKLKETARKAFVAAGGSAADFEGYYQQIVVARTVKKLEEQRNALPIPRI